MSASQYLIDVCLDGVGLDSNESLRNRKEVAWRDYSTAHHVSKPKVLCLDALRGMLLHQFYQSPIGWLFGLSKLMPCHFEPFAHPAGR